MITKFDLIKLIAEEEGLTAKEVTKVVDKAIDLVIRKVAEGETIQIKKFGSFFAVNFKERDGVNPQTREHMVLEAHKLPRFKAGTRFKDAVRGQKSDF